MSFFEEEKDKYCSLMIWSALASAPNETSTEAKEAFIFNLKVIQIKPNKSFQQNFGTTSTYRKIQWVFSSEVPCYCSQRFRKST